MSFIHSSDMVDEDAADLQFPKDSNIASVNRSTTANCIQFYHPKFDISNLQIDSTTKCDTCGNFVKEPYIKCVDCTAHLCLDCFSRGAETQYHHNTHSYLVIHDNIYVFPYTNWTASEEKMFLNLLMLYGLGNWEDISKKLINRSAKECCEHYVSFYLGGIFKEVVGLTNDIYFPRTIPYFCKVKSVDPPRYDSSSIYFKELAGYRAARGDFDISYDNSTEGFISRLELTDWPKKYTEILNKLHIAVFRAYNNRLKERHRRYKIMKNHGLLHINKNHRCLLQYFKSLQSFENLNKFTGTGRFVAFMQIIEAFAFDFLVESLQLFTDYKKYLLKLYELRKNGIKTLYGGKIYYKLKQKRILRAKIRKAERYKNFKDWNTLELFIDRLKHGDANLFNVTRKRRIAAPLDVTELPGFDHLSDDEKKLCSHVRITPAAYQEYKEIFKRENLKLGSLRLADARKLIKIDVNKIRQIYDFLLENGHINKPYS